MTSERQLRANRANSHASTRPKTRKGKIRPAQNARRHGFSVSILSDPLLCEKAETLAYSLAGDRASPTLLEAACRAAQAQIHLIRIRRCASRSFRSQSQEAQNAIFTDVPDEYAVLDRYERRALSRRKFAIRELDALRL